MGAELGSEEIVPEASNSRSRSHQLRVIDAFSTNCTMDPGVKAPMICFYKTGETWICTREVGALYLTWSNFILTLKLERRLLVGFRHFSDKRIEILFSLNGSKNVITSGTFVGKAVMPRALSLISELGYFTFIALERNFFDELFTEKGKVLRFLSILVIWDLFRNEKSFRNHRIVSK
jgi:hypothetical protein